MKDFIEWLNESNAYCDILTPKGEVIGFVSLPREKYEFLSSRPQGQTLGNLKRHGQVHMSKFSVPTHMQVHLREKPADEPIDTHQDSSNVWNPLEDDIY